MGRIEDPYALVIRMQCIMDTVAKRYGESSKHGKLELPYAPATPLLGVYPKESKPGSSRAISTPMGINGYKPSVRHGDEDPELVCATLRLYRETSVTTLPVQLKLSQSTSHIKGSSTVKLKTREIPALYSPSSS